MLEKIIGVIAIIACGVLGLATLFLIVISGWRLFKDPPKS